MAQVVQTVNGETDEGEGESMRMECPVCGTIGFLQQRGNSCRVGHYAGFKDGKTIIQWHLVKTDGKELMVKNKVDLGAISLNKASEVDRAGFEPATSALRMRRSYQTELPAHVASF